jgi:hypothetical protein
MKIKQSHAILGAVVLALAAAIAWAQSASTPSASTAALGTWELVSHDYGGQQAAPNQRQIKILAPGHFMWVLYDKDKLKTVGAGTGTWALSGDTYTEHVDFIDVEGGQSLNGADVKFTLTVSGDTLTQTGNLGGTNMKEVWKRLP